MDNKSTQTSSNKKSESLLWLIIVTIIIAFALVTVSFAIFLRSGAYDTIKQIIKASNTLAEDDLKGYNVTSPIQADDLRRYGDSLESRIKPLSDSQDFNPEQLSDTTLGL